MLNGSFHLLSGIRKRIIGRTWITSTKTKNLSVSVCGYFGPTRIILRTASFINNRMNLQEVLKKLTSIAPLHLAEAWDNVGLLVEPTGQHTILKLILTNDLTQPVVDEAIAKKCDLIISYHPPIFRAMKRLTQGNVKEKIIVKCIENRIAVFSPHTSYDAAKDGVNDWLLSSLGDLTDVSPVVPVNEDDKVALAKCDLTKDELQRLRETPGSTDSEQLIYFNRRLTYVLSEPKYLLEVSKNKSLVIGMGRRGILSRPTQIRQLIDRVKQHTGLKHLRVAIGENQTLDTEVKTVACCAGSGSTVLQDCDADVYLTGEMSHHDLLHATSHGKTVILCEHSNSERGFLSVLCKRLSAELQEVHCEVSQSDRDPVTII